MIPKIAFLFLTIGNVFHEAPWVNYFAGHEEQYSLYAHSKKSISKSSFLYAAHRPTREKTSWANTMKAQVALLKESLKDPHNVKFIFISESTIPLTTFNDMYERVTQDPRSQFSYRKNPFGNRTFGGLKKLYNNPQWVLLNRDHAQLLVEDSLLLEKMATYPHDQEHYPSTLLARHGELENVIAKDATLCIWEGGSHPHEFKNLTNDCYTQKLIQLIQEKRFLFARKFHKKCDLSLLHIYLPEVYTYPS